MLLYLIIFKEKGLYELLVEVKSYFGNDVSISICKQLVATSDCETLVRVYISVNNCRPDGVDRVAIKKKANQIINEYRMTLIKAGYTLEEIEEMLEILMKAS